MGAENKAMCEPFWLSNLRLFSCIQSTNTDQFKVVGCDDHNLNTDRKRRRFKFRKGVASRRNLIRFLSAANQNVDQRYDVGPLCLISCWSLQSSIYARAGSNYTKSLQLQLQLLWNIDFNYNYNYTIIMLYSITITITPCSFQLQLQLQFHFCVNDTFLWWNIGLIDFGLFSSFGPSTV